MRVVMFCHSLMSDWNHGNAHFLRGVATELMARGHSVDVYEPQDAWSAQQLVAEQGERALTAFRQAYPSLCIQRYRLETLDVARELDGAGLVLVHEWNTPELVRRVGEERARGGRFRLLFHDTHHRAVTAPAELARFALAHYDGVLAFGEVLRARYLENGWATRAWTWHEAADTRVFRPLLARPQGDLVWIGNFGDDERTRELHEFLLRPIAALGLRARVHGVRYPESALEALAEHDVEFGGWLPNHHVPRVFAEHRVTVHVPRRPYATALPGIPTIRPFEALACGIPLVCAPWSDSEGLFTAGADYWVARTGAEMTKRLRQLLHEPETARALAEHGRQTVLARHTCAHRVTQLLAIHRELSGDGRGRFAAAEDAAKTAHDVSEGHP